MRPHGPDTDRSRNEVAGTKKPEKGIDTSVAVHMHREWEKSGTENKLGSGLIPFFQTETSDRQLNSLKLFQPSVFGYFPFLDKAATRLSWIKAPAFLFRERTCFRFGSSHGRTTVGRDEGRKCI